MAISAAQIRSASKVWGASLTLNGEPVDLTEALPTRSLGFTQKRGVCTVKTHIFPNVPAGTPAEVILTLNGESTVFFTGRLDARPISDLPLSYELGLVDSLARLGVPLVQDLVWRGRTFPDAVRDLLHAASIDDTEIASVFDPGSDFVLGAAATITIAKGTEVGSTLDTLLAFGGCGMFVLPDGRIMVADAPGWPADPGPATAVYAFGAVRDAGEYGIITARRSVVGAESVVASFTCVGPRLPNKTIPDATFTLSGVGGSAVVEQYPYCQSEACAKAIASREIVRRNRAATTVDVQAPLNPNLRPGDTIWFRHAELGFAVNTLAILIGITTNEDLMTMAISVGARPADGEISVIPPPAPNFTMKYETQPVSLAGIMAVSTVVECTDTSSDPSGFGITSRAWAADCSGSVKPSPETVAWQDDPDQSAKANPVPNPVFIFPTLDGATISLTVESSSGEGATKTRAVSPGDSERFTRSLSVAAGAEGWRILAGATGWRSFTTTADCTAVPNINDQGPLIAGFANGNLYRTEDRLLTKPDLLYTFPGAVGCIFVNEGTPSEVLVGAGNGLHRSSDGGVSWTLVFAFTHVIQYGESSPANPSEIRVCAGPSLYLSLDGATFAPLLTGKPGTVCRKVASARWGHLAVWAGSEGDVQAAEDIRPWQFEEGHAIDWSGVPADHMPFDLASVTPMQYEEGYIVAAGDACDLVRDGLYGQLTYLASAGALIQLYALRPGAGGFVARYLSTAVGGGPHKLLASGGVYPIDTVAQAYRIGYGSAIAPTQPPQFVLLPFNAKGDADMLWHYVPFIGWMPKVLPEPSGEWRGIAIHPSNQSEWLIWTTRRIYWTNTAGRSWAEIYAPKSGTILDGVVTVQGACFLGIGSRWIFSRYVERWFGVGRFCQSHLATGEGLRIEKEIFGGDEMFANQGGFGGDGTPYQLVTALTPGVGGVAVGYATESVPLAEPGDSTLFLYQVTIDPGLSTYIVGKTPYRPQTVWKGVPGLPLTYNGLISCWSANVAWSPDYASTLPAHPIAAGESAAWCETGLFVGNRLGIAQIRDIETVPSSTIVAAGNTLVGTIVAGSCNRSVGAPTTTPVASTRCYRVYIWNGVVWTALDTPEALTSIGAMGILDTL